jgi:hypothetical protein
MIIIKNIIIFQTKVNEFKLIKIYFGVIYRYFGIF